MIRSVASGIAWLSRTLSTIAGMITALITLIICVEVAVRGIFGGSVQGASEVAILLLVMLIFLGFAGAEANGENFSVSLLTNSLGRRTNRVLGIVTNVTCLGTVGLLAWLSWEAAIDSTVKGEQSYGVIAFPIWPSRLIVATGLTMLGLQFLANILDLLVDREPRRD